MPREQRSTQAREVDAIIHAKWLIPMTETGLVLQDHCLVIHQQLIREILPSTEVSNTFFSKEVYHLDEHVLIPGLINAAYNKSDLLVLVMDNRITAMTGHQQNPGMGL